MKTAAAFCYLLSAVWTAKAKINVDGVEGGDVTFVCQHKLASNNAKAFCKDPCKSTTDILAAVQPGVTVQKGRITLVDSGTGAFTVNFNRLQLSDAGTYWCTVDRTLFSTFTAVYLTVKEGVVTVTPDISPRWTSAKIFSTTQLIPEVVTDGPARISTTVNCTKTEEHSTSTLHASIGAVSALALLVCAACCRKCTRVSRPQAQMCSSSSADERAFKKQPPEMTPSAQQPSLDPPSSVCTAADKLPSPIYENCRIFRENQSDHDFASRIYIKPLPPAAHEQIQEGSARKHTEKSTAGVGSEANAGPCCDTEPKPRTLWFGLDLSGAI